MAGTPSSPADRVVLAAYDFRPSGVTFDPAATLAAGYEPEKLPEHAVVVMAYYDEELDRWVELDTAGHPAADGAVTARIVKARIRHFTRFAVLAKVPMPGKRDVFLAGITYGINEAPLY